VGGGNSGKKKIAKKKKEGSLSVSKGGQAMAGGRAVHKNLAGSTSGKGEWRLEKCL